MGKISVTEAARRLGVGVPRVHQRIADGSLPAVRIGSQWTIDEASLLSVEMWRAVGRPLSRRSAWALLAVSQDDQPALGALAPVERARARDRLRCLLAEAVAPVAHGEAGTSAVASRLRSWLRRRAERHLYQASPRDLPDLRGDGRLTLSGVSHVRSGIASGEFVEGYISARDVGAVVDDYVLTPVPVEKDANSVLHIVVGPVPDGLNNVTLFLAADLAEHGRPREQARAVELLRSIAEAHPELTAGRSDPRRDRRQV